MEHVLESGGYDVDPVATVAGARALLRDRQYHLLLADGILPDGTGFMVAEDAERRGIQAIIVTAYAERFAKESLVRFGLLIKPVRPDELLSAVEGALGRYPRRKEKPARHCFCHGTLGKPNRFSRSAISASH